MACTYLYNKLHKNMENNIGKLNAIFMQNMPNIIMRKDGSKIIKEYVSLFKDNSALLKEFLVFEFIENQKNSENLKDYITESISCLDNINKKQLSELNEKLANFMAENKIEQISDIKNEVLLENIHQLIFTRKSLKTINERIEKFDKIIKFINENSIAENEEDLITEKSDAFYNFVIGKFNNKYEVVLNENEKQMFKAITSAETLEQKANLFEEKRLECLTITNDFLNESIDNITKEKLLNVKEKLLEQKFNDKTYIEDMLSFVELKDTLSD